MMQKIPKRRLDDAEDFLDLIMAANCSATPLVLGTLINMPGVVIGATFCVQATWATIEAKDGIEDIEDELPKDVSEVPTDCTLMIRISYIGLGPTRVELERCGAYSGEYYRIGG